MGNPLQAGDILEIEKPEEKSIPLKKLSQEMIPPSSPQNPLRVILGPQEDRFTRGGIETFLSSDYKVTHQSDRMGYRTGRPEGRASEGCGYHL